ncbi:hypothetical protein [Marinactinospora rubrisoli]|uniref:NB-ARC domain-containing protein n=1 Tax=Marinactinospora rubrisoli TaxID=2715399 RepID=A0ABW2KIR2_9ACTN
MRDPVNPGDEPSGVRNRAENAGTAVQAGSVAGNVNVNVHQRAGDVPHEVPKPPPGWHDREDALRRGRAAIDPGAEGRDGVPIFVVEGPRGVGKSTLAHKLASVMAGLFADGQLYVDYTLLDPDGLAGANEALGQLLVSLGVPSQEMPARLPERLARYRSVTHDRRLLVVVDGATQAAQVAQLVPQGPGSAVLAVGSRARLGELALDHAEWLRLDPLKDADSAELLAKQCGRRLDGVDAHGLAAIVAACEGLPLALVIVAGRLKADPDLSIAALAAEVADEQRRLRALSVSDGFALTSIFNVGYAGLSADAAAVYRALGCWPGRVFDRALAADAVGRTPSETAAPLAELCAADLLVKEAEGTFRFVHGLVRLHALDRATARDGAAAGGTVLRAGLDRYVATLAHADLAIMGPRLSTVDARGLAAGHDTPFPGDRGTARGRALAWLRAERDGILAVLRATEAEGLDEYGYRIAELATALYLNHRYLADWVETGSRGADAARRQGAHATEARLRSLLSRPLTDLGRADQARTELERALYLVREEQDPLLAASVWEFYGRYLDTVDRPRALDAYAHSLRLNLRSDDPRAPRGAALARYFAGRTRLAMGEAEQAVTEIRAAIAAFERLTPPDTRMANRARGSLADALAAAGHTMAAIATYRAAIADLERDDHDYYEAEYRQSLGAIYAELRAVEDARTHLNRAYEIFARFRSPRAAEVAALLNGLG